MIDAIRPVAEKNNLMQADFWREYSKGLMLPS